MSVNGEFDRSLSSMLGFLRETGERLRTASTREAADVKQASAALTDLQRELEQARATRAGNLSSGAEHALAAVAIESGGRDLHLDQENAREYRDLAEHLAAVSSAVLGRPAPQPTGAPGAAP